MSELSSWPAISLAISSAKLLVPVHLFLVANRIQNPLQTHIPSPENLGYLMTNSFAVVGSRSVSFSIVLQSWNSCFDSGKSFHQTIHGFTCRILLIFVIKCFPVGTAISAFRIFPTSFSIRLNGTPFVMRTILCISASITLCLSRES